MTDEAEKPVQIERRDRAEQTREAILRAAIQEFSAHGLSGARTEAIAEAAGANKALLYYYFKSKQGLYEAAVSGVSAEVVKDALAALDPVYSAGERLLRTALNHFDRILTKREFQSLLQQEMVRFQREDRGATPLFFQSAFLPLMEKLQGAVDEGFRSGELCQKDWLQVMYTIFGANVFYFLSAPMVQAALPIKPFETDALRERREAAVRFMGNALFTDRVHGTELADRVLRELPMPEVKDFEFRRMKS